MKHSLTTKNLLYIVGAVALTLWFVWGLFADKPIQFDPISHCQTGKPQPQVTVLFESGAVSPNQQEQIQRIANYLPQALAQNARISLYRLADANAIPPAPLYSACSPGAVQRGMGSIQRKAAKAFKADFYAALSGLKIAKPVQSFPLLEGIHVVAQSTPWEQGGELILVGELQPNATLLSQYCRSSVVGQFKDFLPAHKAYFDRHKLNLRGVTVTLFQLTPSSGLSLTQTEQNQAFWGDYFHFHRASKVQFCSLDAKAQPHCLTLPPTGRN